MPLFELHNHEVAQRSLSRLDAIKIVLVTETRNYQREIKIKKILSSTKFKLLSRIAADYAENVALYTNGDTSN